MNAVKFFGGVKMPEWWFYRAAVAGKNSNSTGTVFIGLLIWQQYSLKRKTDGLKLPVNLLAKADLGRAYVRTALEVLESDGLIQVKRYAYKSPEIALFTTEKEAYPRPPQAVDRQLRELSDIHHERSRSKRRDYRGRWVSNAPY
jgi:hypothetical protein